MVEPFSATFAVAGLAGFFTACIDCFEYIQLGRKFSKNYQTSLLRLDIVRLRLSRWGESVKIYENGRTALELEQCDRIGLQSPEEVERVKEILGKILTLFTDAEHISNRYGWKTNSGGISSSTDLETCNPETDLGPHLLPLHNKTRDLAIRRQKGTNLVKKATWALYDEKQFNRLIQDVSELVDSLIDLFPATERQQQLCRVETDQLSNEPGLSALKDAATGMDELLQTTLDQAIEMRKGHTFKNVRVLDRARVENGNFVAVGALSTGPGNVYDCVTVSGDARVRNGDNHGGKSVFDD